MYCTLRSHLATSTAAVDLSIETMQAMFQQMQHSAWENQDLPEPDGGTSAYFQARAYI